PVIAPMGAQTAIEGQTFSVPIGAADPDIPVRPLVFSLDNGPAGASIDPTTGLFTWDVPNEQLGTFLVTVRVTEVGQDPLSTIATFNITVVSNFEIGFGIVLSTRLNDVAIGPFS